MSNGKTKSALVPTSSSNGRFADWCSEEMLGAVEIVGNCAARLNRIMARACWKRAPQLSTLVDAADLFLQRIELRVAKISHSLQRSVRSPGWRFSTLERFWRRLLECRRHRRQCLWYFGPTMQPASSSTANVTTTMPGRNHNHFPADTVGDRLRWQSAHSHGVPVMRESLGSRIT